jgi:hypothetical protein
MSGFVTPNGDAARCGRRRTRDLRPDCGLVRITDGDGAVSRAFIFGTLQMHHAAGQADGDC